MQAKVNAQYLLALCQRLTSIFPPSNTSNEFRLKSADNPVTETDLKLDHAIHEILLRDGFLEEEIICEERSRKGTHNSDTLWIIDPLDGTKEFIQGLPEYAVSIAFLKNGRFHSSVVYNPAAPFIAICDEEGLQSPNSFGNFVPTWDTNALLCSRSEWKKGLLQSIDTRGYLLVPIGSIAYKMALVAAGKAIGTISVQPKHSWDIAAGTALIEKAGGIVTDLKGNALNYSDPFKLFSDGILAARDHKIHQELLEEFV